MSGISNKKHLLAAAALSSQMLLLGAGAAWADHDHNQNIKMKVLAINDFHGQIGAGKKVSGRDVGSAPVLAAYLKNAQKGVHEKSFIVSAGDLIGASPANSALLQDEPTIQFLNKLANEECENRMSRECNLVATIGNHELDEGVKELQRLINGGNHPNGPFLQSHYSGARFPFIAANVVDSATGKTLLPPYVIKEVDDVKVAFIGAILKETPGIVAPAGVAGLTFLDEADAINSYIPELQKKGIKAIIAVIHQGGAQNGTTISGDIVPLINRLDGEIDVVISGHSHSSINGMVKNAAGNDVLVTQAYSAGTAFADISLEIDRHTKDIVSKSAAITTTWVTNLDGTPAVTPDWKIAELVAKADKIVEPLVSLVVGETSDSITRTQNPAGESALGNLIADAQRAYEGTDFAFMNPGGIRADLDKGPVTWGKLFTIQPFSNQMVRMTLTGQQIYDLLGQQWSNPASPKMLQISGLTYSWINNGPGKAGTITEVRKNGAEIDTTATYTVTTNNFLAGGGDGFSLFKSGLNQVIDAADIDVLVSYIRSLPVPFDINIENRIIRSEAAPIQFVYTSDAHYGITRKDLAASTTTVTAQAVNQALVSSINELPAVTLPCTDGGVNACTAIGAVDFVATTGDIANRQESKKGIQSAAASWSQFEADYLNGLTVKDKANSTAPLYIVPGNHDVSNAIGYYKTLSPATDATSIASIYNLMLQPSTPLTKDTYNYTTDRVNFSRDIGGVHFVFISMWPDSAARAWMDADLRKVSSTTPVVLFTHDEPNIETKHLINPNGAHSINSTDMFENLVLGEAAGGYSSVLTIAEPSTIEQNALVAWLKGHKNIVAYFHGNTNYNEFYSYAGPNSDISLNTFRVDSPLKGMISGIDAADGKGDPGKLSYQVIAIDKEAKSMTVREYLWNTKTWGASATVPLTPRAN